MTESRVAEYRTTAAALRRLAHRMRFRESREQLLEIAAQFERLADSVERIEAGGATGDC